MGLRSAQVDYCAWKVLTRMSTVIGTSQLHSTVQRGPIVSEVLVPSLVLVYARSVFTVLLRQKYPSRPHLDPTLVTMAPQIIHFVSLALSSLSGSKTSATCALQATDVMKEEPICQQSVRSDTIDQLSKPIGASNAQRGPSRTRGVSKTTWAVSSVQQDVHAKKRV